MFSTIFVHLAEGGFLCSLLWGMILYLTLQIRRSHTKPFIGMLSEVADSEGTLEQEACVRELLPHNKPPQT